MEKLGSILRPDIDRSKDAIKPIPTECLGTRFRSRLEARWAVFFDRASIPWRYEFEGFQLPSGWYVPDFWLPKLRVWLEIKPEPALSGSRPFRLCVELADTSGNTVALASGEPTAREGLQVFAGEGWLDDRYSFAECPSCSRIGVAFEARGARVCGSGCFPLDDDGEGWSPRLEQARRDAVGARFW